MIKIFLAVILLTSVAINAHAGGCLTIAAVGDIMMGTTHRVETLPPEDGEGIFDHTKNYFKDAHIIFGNLEGPLFDGGKWGKCGKNPRPGSQCYDFRTPVRYTKHLKAAGFNVMSIANNHAFDFGAEGLMSTIDALYSSGIKPAGGEMVAFLNIEGRKVAVLGFSYSESFISHSVIDIENAKHIVSGFKRDNDIVIVSFHAGAEGKSAVNIRNRREIFLGENRGNVMRFSKAAIDAGADMVIGHGPHVLRAMQVYKNKLIAYSLGNFLTYGVFNVKGPSGVSVILRADIDPDSGDFVRGRLIPVKLLNQGIPEIDNDGEAIGLLRGLIKKDIRNSRLKISDDGELSLVN